MCLNGNGPGAVLCVDRTPRLGRLAQRPQPGSVTCRPHGPMPAVGRAPAPRAALTSRPIELIPAITWHQHTLPHCSHSATQVGRPLHAVRGLCGVCAVVCGPCGGTAARPTAPVRARSAARAHSPAHGVAWCIRLCRCSRMLRCCRPSWQQQHHALTCSDMHWHAALVQTVKVGLLSDVNTKKLIP